MVHFKLVTYAGNYMALHSFRPRALDFLMEMYTRYNHTVEHVLTDTQFSEEINGTWTAEVGTLVRGDADISLSLHIYDSQTSDTVNLQYVAYKESVGILSTQRSSSSLGDVMETFYVTEVAVWILMSLTILHIMMFNKITAILISIPEADKASQDNNLLTLFGLLLYYGSSRIPKHTCTRVLLQFYLFSVMIFVCFLFANMKSSVTIIRPTFYKTIEDILQEERANVRFLDSGYIPAMFKNSPDKEYDQFWKRVTTTPGSIIDDVTKLALNDKEIMLHASNFEKMNEVWVGDMGTLNVFTEQKYSFFREEIVLVNYRMRGIFHFLWLKKNLEQEKALHVKKVYSNIVESGLIFPLRDLITGQIPYKMRKLRETREVEMEFLMLSSLSNAVMLWAVGLLASGVCFVLEISLKDFRPSLHTSRTPCP